MAATVDSSEMLDDRDARALTEAMDIYVDDPATADTEVAVYNDGERHIVNPETGFCSCDDWHYRQPDGGCKHLRRYRFVTGAREIPQWADRAAIDSDIPQVNE